MNFKLYKSLIKQCEDTMSVTRYNLSKQWIEKHLERLGTEFSFVEIGAPVKVVIDDEVRIAKVKGFFIDDVQVLVHTDEGNVWYYECMKPTQKELKENLVV